MEDALVQTKKMLSKTSLKRLNPCFNGRCTRTQGHNGYPSGIYKVLILVLMEDALVRYYSIR